ncbi:hypothetical protein J1614_002633 [Plenodomus biglobosus]|nr:hypothetical protein J1614_002633 [Plenodomus biglobosus]
MNTKKEYSGLYPMCPQARAAVVELEPEKYLEPYKLPGASNTPSYFGYAPADWTWTPGNSPEALFKALLYSKATNKEGNLVSQQDVDAEIQIAVRETKLDDILYHPMNRTEPVFHGEPLAAKVACAFQRSLWVFCPHLLENVDWNAPWHTEPGQRPYFHVRFGPGEQGDYPPVVIGLLPVPNDKPKAFWFAVSEVEDGVGEAICEGHGCEDSLYCEFGAGGLESVAGGAEDGRAADYQFVVTSRPRSGEVKMLYTILGKVTILTRFHSAQSGVVKIVA